MIEKPLWYKYFNVSADLNATINLSINIGYLFGNFLEGDWNINSKVSSNWTMKIWPRDVYNIFEWKIHESGSSRSLEINRVGPTGNYFGIKIGPIQLTPGKLYFEGTLNDLPSGEKEVYCYIENQGFNVNGDLITLEFSRFHSISLGTFELLDAGDFDLLLTIQEDGPFQLAIENNLSMNIETFNINWGVDFLKLEKIKTKTKIKIRPGSFYFSGEKLNGEDFDLQFIIKNGIFEFERKILTLKFGDHKLSIDRRDFEKRDENNTITIKARIRGLPTCKDNAIYINTDYYINFTRTNITFYENDVLKLHLSSFVSLKFRFDNFTLGFIDNKFTQKGKIDFDVTILGIFNFQFSLGIGDDSGNYQELKLSGILDEQKIGIYYDANGCTEDITIDPKPFNFWKYRITPSATIYAQNYLDIETDLNPVGPSQDEKGLIYIYVDTNNESIAEFSIEVVRVFNDGTKRGINITSSDFKADKFNISYKTKFKGLWWGPIWNSYNKSGYIEGNLEIWIILRILGDNWKKIFDSDGLVVLLENQHYQVLLGQTLEFHVFVFGGTEPYTYNWILPEGTMSDQKNPSYTFNNLSNYQVEVQVVDARGLTGVSYASIEVVEQLNGDESQGNEANGNEPL
jgi:hypothetical protein